MIKDLLRDVYSPYSIFVDRCVATLISFLLVVLITFVIFMFTSFRCNAATTIAVVQNKEVVNGKDVQHPVPIGGIIIQMTHNSSSSYKLILDSDDYDKQWKCGINKKSFDIVSIGEKIKIDYILLRGHISRESKMSSCWIRKMEVVKE